MKTVRIGFKYKNKIFFIEGEICKSFFSKLMGLMFGRHNNNLIFVFNKSVLMPIHSFFVFKKFLAVWIKNNEVIDVKIVNPWKLHIAPKERFDTLLEIPFESADNIKWFSDGD